MRSNIKPDMTNSDVSMRSYLNFVMDKPKIRLFPVLVRILVRIELKIGTGVNF